MVRKADETETEATTEAQVIGTVYGRAQQGQQRGRVLFEGTEEDAQAFIANNFPREHSEEAGPDYTYETNEVVPEESEDSAPAS